METIAPKWKDVAVAMGFNKERIESIEKDEHYKQEEATREMFGRWLKGEHDLKPVTWDVLIQCLKQAKLPDIAKMLSNIQFVSVYVVVLVIMQVITNSLILQGRKEKKFSNIKSPKQASSRSEMGVSIGTGTEVLQRDCGSQNCGGMHTSMFTASRAHCMTL